MSACEEDKPGQAAAVEQMSSDILRSRAATGQGKADAGGDKALAVPEGSAAVIGMLNYRPDDGDQEAEIVSLEEVKGRMEDAVALAGKLAGLFNGLKFMAPKPASRP